MRHLKLLAIIAFVFSFKLSTAQCSTDILEKRLYIKSNSQKEKVVFIRMNAKMKSDLLTYIASKTRKTGQYINITLSKGQRPNLKALIDILNNEKRKIRNSKQMVETNKLDQLTYCYIDFEIDCYNKIQSIIIQNSIPEILGKIKEYAVTMFPVEDAKIRDIMNEVFSIEKSFPINVTR